jgi:hypothetical protein
MSRLISPDRLRDLTVEESGRQLDRMTGQHARVETIEPA